MSDATILRRLAEFLWIISRALVYIIEEFDAKPPVRQQFVSHYRKDRTQFGPLGHSSF